MQQTPALSPTNRSVVEAALGRMTRDAFGAIATLPLYCLGELPASDRRQIVLDHYDIWHSCLVVAREVLRSEGGQDEQVWGTIESLLSAAADLRDAYLAICEASQKRHTTASDSYARLVSAYEHLPVLVRQLAGELELDDSFLPAAHSIRHLSHERTLNWLGTELRNRADRP